MNNQTDESLYTLIYSFVKQIPRGKVTTYGRIADLVCRHTWKTCTPRMVGYALSALKRSQDLDEVPWQRVINAQGRISIHGDGWGNALQRELLESEGVVFDSEGRVNLDEFEWFGPLE